MPTATEMNANEIAKTWNWPRVRFRPGPEPSSVVAGSATFASVIVPSDPIGAGE